VSLLSRSEPKLWWSTTAATSGPRVRTRAQARAVGAGGTRDDPHGRKQAVESMRADWRREGKVRTAEDEGGQRTRATSVDVPTAEPLVI
jgi:hypothetical protein